MKRHAFTLFVCLGASSFSAVGQTLFVDPMDDDSAWSTFNSAGVEVDLNEEGRSLRLDIDFTKGSGYGGVIRNLNVPLPAQYRISFTLRATVPVNNFEVKISPDSSGENIWWVNRRNYEYPRSWKRYTLKKRHFSFAWGPKPALHPDTLRRIELVVTAASGGKGSVWFDDLEIVQIPPPPQHPPQPIVSASSYEKGHPPTNIIEGRTGGWKARKGHSEWIEIDYGYEREFNGMQLTWSGSTNDLNYAILGSADGRQFDTLRTVRHGAGGRRVLYMPESEARYVRIALDSSAAWTRRSLETCSLISGDSLRSVNEYIELLADDAPMGFYPRYFYKQKSYWTIAGVPGAQQEALFSEDGAWEAGHFRFSIEPFIRTRDDTLLTWANATLTQSLEKEYIPVPSVVRKYSGLDLRTTLLAEGEAGRSTIMARYLLKNTSNQRQQGTLFLAVRPFQVNPSYQWLNNEGGVTRLRTIRLAGTGATIDDAFFYISRKPSWQGGTPIDAGEIVHHLETAGRGGSTELTDDQGLASAGFGFDYSLKPGDSFEVIAAVPLDADADRWRDSPPSPDEFHSRFIETVSFWERKLNTISLSGSSHLERLFNIARSTLAYVLINKDGHGIQPGSRSYERSWIRDGSMTSSALLKYGVKDDVRDFLHWYAGYQYENGMVPCVVDRRGPDPVPENDSHGELIFGLMEYFRFSKDTSFLREHWKNIKAAVQYMETLRASRMTDEFRDGPIEKQMLFGLMPESISHEGYSAKPMHSYWDDFFALKGFKDAAEGAAVLGLTNQHGSFDSLAKAFRSDFYRSVALSMRRGNIGFFPGCAELADFDATSTTIALFPCGEREYAPKSAIDSTFDRYRTWFMQRARGEIDWTGYTPYEIRNVGAFIYLGNRRVAHTMLDWLLTHQRPAAWNHWAEVVWKDERHPAFIGDMPHTWVGSDFMNTLRAMFVYEVPDHRALMIGSGLREEWIQEGMSVKGLPTHFGELSYSVRQEGERTVRMQISGSLDAQVQELRIMLFDREKPVRSAMINGVPASISPEGFVVASRLPADVKIEY